VGAERLLQTAGRGPTASQLTSRRVCCSEFRCTSTSALGGRGTGSRPAQLDVCTPRCVQQSNQRALAIRTALDRFGGPRSKMPIADRACARCSSIQTGWVTSPIRGYVEQSRLAGPSTRVLTPPGAQRPWPVAVEGGRSRPSRAHQPARVLVPVMAAKPVDHAPFPVVRGVRRGRSSSVAGGGTCQVDSRPGINPPAFAAGPEVLVGNPPPTVCVASPCSGRPPEISTSDRPADKKRPEGESTMRS